MRPSPRVDLVNRVEQDDVLHVGERGEAGRHEGDALAYVLRGSQSGAAAAVSVGHHEFGGDELVEELLHGCVDLAVSGLVALLELEHDGLGRASALERLPDLDRSALQTEVMT